MKTTGSRTLTNTPEFSDVGPLPADRTTLQPRTLSDNQNDRGLYPQLRHRLEEAGCFRPTHFAYGFKIAVILGAVIFGYLALLSGPEPILRFALIALVAIASVQAGFLAHDAGDGAVTKNRQISLGLRQVLMSFVSAMSSSYFHYLHKVHHLTVHRGAGGLGGGEYTINPYEVAWLKRLVAWNGILFMVVTVCLRGLMFRLESLRYIYRNPKTTISDRTLMALHGLFWLIVPLPLIGMVDMALNYALIMLVSGLYVGTVLILNHEGMSAAKSLRHLSVIERTTRTTRNLGQSIWNDFIFGGVNNHIEHHLFPQIPTMRLGRARTITRKFCRENGIAYAETSFARATIEAAKHFRASSPTRLAVEALS